jgi:hypothetical protein
MSSRAENLALIDQLAGELKPVRRLASPWRRVVLWFAAVAWVVGLFALFTDFERIMHAMMATTDMWLSFVGALGTTVLAAVAALMTSVPGRSARWALAPLPALALWLGASTAGCMRTAPAPFTRPESMMHPMLCLYVIVLVAAPLSALLMWQIIRACPLRPGLSASLAGLAGAGAAATVLSMVHPFDATFLDLGFHALAVVIVVLGVRVFGARAMQRQEGLLF